ncbi:hypothetical protein WMY93_025111 [Mugilogobius chulae]|uniref:Transmembrane protein 69 n=1 Tax=Mugilogobius chulae TaxID=88201 RepID=A0AAW0NE14_9GOBI
MLLKPDETELRDRYCSLLLGRHHGIWSSDDLSRRRVPRPQEQRLLRLLRKRELWAEIRYVELHPVCGGGRPRSWLLCHRVCSGHKPRPKCEVNTTTHTWDSPFNNGDYLKNTSLWDLCEGPKDIVHWHLSLFSVLLVMGLVQVALCAVQVVNGLLGALCGDCCGCCGGNDGADYKCAHDDKMFSFAIRRGALISHKLLSSISSSPRCLKLSQLSQHSTISSNPTERPFLSPRSTSQCLTFPALAHPLHSSAVRLKKRPQPDPPPRELDLLRYDMKDLPKSPKPALYLGFSGLLPFVCPTLFMAMTENYIPELAYAQVAYGASILSSPAKPDWINLANSVVPSLLAWIAMLMTENIAPAATMVIMGLGIALHYDLSLLPTYPSWFKALRSVLTVVAALSLFGMLMVYGVCPEKKLFTGEKK